MIIFKNFDFLLLWLAQTLSQAGTRMYQIAMIWWILAQVGGSGGKFLSIFMVMGALPSIFLVKIIGRIIERNRSKNILVLSDFFAFIVIAAVYWSLERSILNLPAVYFAGFLIAVVEAFFNPTINKALPELVEKENLESAIAFQASTQYLASFGGAVVGAFLIDKLGIPLVVLFNSVSYLISGFCNFLIRFKYAKPISESSNAGHDSEGLGILSNFPLLRKVLFGFGLVNFFATPILVILPLYVKETLSGSASLLGLLESGLWIGLLAGTFSSRFLGFTSNTIRLGAICLFSFGFFLFAPGLIVSKAFYLCMLVFAGLALGINNVKFITLFQKVVAPELKGKFFALMNALISFTFPVAYMFFGFLSDLLTPPKVCLIQGTGVMCLALYFWQLSKFESKLVSKIDDC